MPAPHEDPGAAEDDALTLYQGDILRFGRRPHNFGPLPGANVEVRGDSPICGDHMSLFLDFRAARVVAARFTSTACCAVCKASASMMTDALKQKSLIEVHLLRRAFVRMVEQGDALTIDRRLLGPLAAFERLHRIPSRAECALLPWNTLQTALVSPLLAHPPGDKVVPLRRPGKL
jgi:nitrogen fixation NifU-like protein